MKKRMLMILPALLALCLLCGTALAAGSSRQLDLVTDAAGLLTDSQRAELESRAEELSGQYECDVVIVTVDSLSGYTAADFNSALYEQYELGWGEEKSGVCLLVSTENRDYDLMAHGTGNTAFTDYGKGILSDKFTKFFRDDDWYGGFRCYLDTCGEFLQAASEGKPVDRGSDPYDKFSFLDAVITLAVCFLPALVTVLVMKRRMKTAVPQAQANAYVEEEGVRITESSDQFLNTTQDRVLRVRTSSGGTTTGSSGNSHQSGKF